jgi:hypothetical protein
VRTRLALFFVLGLALAGCTKAVTIVEPQQPISAPIKVFKVKFAPFFASGSFRAELDGQDITPEFVPAAIAGGTSHRKLPDTFEGFTGGTWINTSSPPRPFPVGTLPPDVHFNPATSGPSVPSGGAVGGSGGPPAPNIPRFTHTLHVSGKCNGMICGTADEVVFFPIHLVGVPTNLDVKIGNTVQAAVETFPAMSMPLTVRVRPFNNGVSLNGGPPGNSIFVKVPANGTSAPFKVTGLVSTTLLLVIEAPGVQMGRIDGLVNP